MFLVDLFRVFYINISFILPGSENLGVSCKVPVTQTCLGNCPQVQNTAWTQILIGKSDIQEAEAQENKG